MESTLSPTENPKDTFMVDIVSNSSHENLGNPSNLSPKNAQAPVSNLFSDF